MFKTKYKKHLLTLIVTVLLLVSINLNSFALSSLTVDFNKGSYRASIVTSSGVSDVTRTTARGRVTYKGVPCTAFQYNSSYEYNHKILLVGADISFYSDTQYKFSGKFACQNSFLPDEMLFSLTVYITNSSGESLPLIPLLNDFHCSSTTDNWTTFNGTFRFPDTAGYNESFQLFLIVIFTTYPTNIPNTLYYLSDVVFEIDDPMYGQHYTPPDNPMNDMNDKIESVDKDLPTIDDVDLSGLMNSFDFSEYNQGFSSFNDVFSKVLTATNMTSVLLFTLTFGLGIYIIGRRLRG